LAGVAFGFTTVGIELIPAWLPFALMVVGAVFLHAYVRHARVAPTPLINLKLLQVQTFRASVLGAATFRIGIAPLPFLLPLLFQLGFGMTPLKSGLLTFAGAGGAMAMRICAAPILRRFGIKRVVLTNIVLATGFIAACALFRPDTPYIVIVLVLLAGGF